MMISADQAREARKLLGWPLTRLASKCQIGVTSIRNFENGKTNPTPFKVQAIRRALEAAGIEFDDKEHGVRMREGRPRRSRLPESRISDHGRAYLSAWASRWAPPPPCWPMIGFTP